MFNVTSRSIRLKTYAGETNALVTEPDATGPFPAVVFGAEAMGPNRFGVRVATDLAAQGYVTITPDYYRGGGPSQPDNYDDFTEVMAAIEALDFRQATFDILAGVDWAREQPNVDPAKVAVWGYCTGGTLAMLAAGLDRRLAAAVLYFPSQPTFHELTPKRPMHAMDLIWSINAPVLFISGDQDPILGPDVLAEIEHRFKQWGIDHEIRCYAGAGHAFSAEAAPHMYNAEAATSSWAASLEFLTKRMVTAG